MRKYFAALVIAGAAFIYCADEASAWVCRARSPTGAWGRGWHTYSLSYARARALAECAIRTPTYSRCYITGCG